MSTTVELNLPDALAQEAKAKGLLQSDVMTELLERELKRRRACEDFGGMLQQLHSVTGDEMTGEEVQTEIEAVRTPARTR